MKLNVLAKFSKILKYKFLWKSIPVGAEMFHEEGRKDGRETNSRFLQFCERIWQRNEIC
jgi:hypothetical protein